MDPIWDGPFSRGFYGGNRRFDFQAKTLEYWLLATLTYAAFQFAAVVTFTGKKKRGDVEGWKRL